MSNSRLLPTLWASFDRFSNEMDRWLENLGVASPALNVWETADSFHLEAEVPGLTQDQVTIAVTHKTQLLLQGERKWEEPAEGRWHRRERGQGRFQRVIELPAEVDADKVEAKLENGLLYLTLPKAEEAKPRRISVKSAE